MHVPGRAAAWLKEMAAAKGELGPSQSGVIRSQADFSLPSLHPKIPFPAAGFRGPIPFGSPGILGVLGGKNAISAGPSLLRVQSERLELPAPFGWRLAQPFDSDASRQPSIDRCSNEVRCEERERDGHVDLAHTTF